jgi:hypothetical protein
MCFVLKIGGICCQQKGSEEVGFELGAFDGCLEVSDVMKCSKLCHFIGSPILEVLTCVGGSDVCFRGSLPCWKFRHDVSEAPTYAMRDESEVPTSPVHESNLLDSDPNSSNLVGNLMITSWKDFLLG